MNIDNESFCNGFIVGALLMLFFWLFGNDMAENCKVDAGYLTYKNTVYAVVEYDTLDNPVDNPINKEK